MWEKSFTLSRSDSAICLIVSLGNRRAFGFRTLNLFTCSTRISRLVSYHDFWKEKFY